MSDRTAAKVTSELFEALGSSLDISVVLENAYPLLARLVPADYGALGVSRSGKGEDFTWSVAEMPAAFFGAYSEMAAHDFVRDSVVRRPNLVLRDQDMVSRAQLERNLMYSRAREVGAPIEHVMAVMLHADQRWQSGLSLYRSRRRPFTSVERARLQRVTPALSNAVRNCHLLGAAAEWKRALERLLDSSDAAILLVTEDGREVARSERAASLLTRWFERGVGALGALPPALRARLRDEPGQGEGALHSDQGIRRRLGSVLRSDARGLRPSLLGTPPGGASSGPACTRCVAAPPQPA